MRSLIQETRRRTINRQAETLYERMGLAPQFDITKVIKTLGGQLVKNSELGLNVEAKISETEDNSFRIECPDLLKVNERYTRFSIAHELGHLFLHMLQSDGNGGYKICGEFERGKKNFSIREWEADEFAAAFLMPENVFRTKVDEVWADDTIDDKIGNLATSFNVSYGDILTRGRGLEIWE